VNVSEKNFPRGFSAQAIRVARTEQMCDGESFDMSPSLTGLNDLWKLTDNLKLCGIKLWKDENQFSSTWPRNGVGDASNDQTSCHDSSKGKSSPGTRSTANPPSKRSKTFMQKLKGEKPKFVNSRWSKIKLGIYARKGQ
jgi:hypothetical protein